MTKSLARQRSVKPTKPTKDPLLILAYVLLALPVLFVVSGRLWVRPDIQGVVFAGLAVGSAVAGFWLLRMSSGGVLPAWKEPLLDASLPSIGAGTPEEWLRGRSSLGGGAAGSANLQAAAVRAAWWEPEPRSAVADLRWKVTPDPELGDLKRATRAGLRAARRAVPGKGGVKIVGGLKRVPGPDIVTVRIVAKSHASQPGWQREIEEAFARAFERRMKAYELQRET